MSLLFPVYRQARCSPVARAARSDFAPLLSLLDDAFTPVRHQRRTFAPRFNVSEASDFYQLEGELPGVEQKDISVEFTDEHTLLIRGRVEKHSTSGSAAESAAPAEATTSEAAAVADDAASQTSSRKATVEDEHEGEWTEVEGATTSEASPSTSTTVAESSKGKEKEVASQQPQQPKSRTWVSERFTGEFSRTFSFADRVNQDAVSASLQNGILSIVVPKAAKPENRKITVS